MLSSSRQLDKVIQTSRKPEVFPSGSDRVNNFQESHPFSPSVLNDRFLSVIQKLRFFVHGIGVEIYLSSFLDRTVYVS
jgi:hypothetical protein